VQKTTGMVVETRGHEVITAFMGTGCKGRPNEFDKPEASHMRTRRPESLLSLSVSFRTPKECVHFAYRQVGGQGQSACEVSVRPSAAGWFLQSILHIPSSLARIVGVGTVVIGHHTLQ
jgi:hypothetical protein